MATKENVLDAVGDRVRDRSTGTQNQILEPAFDDVMREMVRRGAIRKAIRTESTFAFVAAQRVYTFTDSPATGMGLARVPEEAHSIYVPAWGADEDQVFIDHRSPRAFEVEVEETGGSTTTGRPYIWRFTAPGTGIEVHKVPTSTYASTATIEYTIAPAALATSATITFLTDAELPVLQDGILQRIAPLFESVRDQTVIFQNSYERGLGDMIWDRYREDHRNEILAPNELVQ